MNIYRRATLVRILLMLVLSLIWTLKVLDLLFISKISQLVMDLNLRPYYTGALFLYSAYWDSLEPKLGLILKIKRLH